MIDADYKHYIEADEKQQEVEVSTDAIVNRIRQQKRYRDIERLHNQALHKSSLGAAKRSTVRLN